MKSILLLAVTLAASASAAPDTNAIDHLVQRLSTNGGWLNGAVMAVWAPSNAAPEKIVAEAIPHWRRNEKEQITSYRIREIRALELKQLTPVYGAVDAHTGQLYRWTGCFAAEVESDSGLSTIFVCFYHGDGSWWTRFYDLPKALEQPDAHEPPLGHSDRTNRAVRIPDFQPASTASGGR
jgi:hypothetical protein